MKSYSLRNSVFLGTFNEYFAAAYQLRLLGIGDICLNGIVNFDGTSFFFQLQINYLDNNLN